VWLSTGFWIGFIDHLQIASTNNYNTIAISTLYSSIEHTLQCSQSVTRRFLVTAPTMAIPLPQVLSSQPPVQNSLNWFCPLFKTSRYGQHRKHSSSNIYNIYNEIRVFFICLMFYSYWSSFFECKAARAWSWSVTSVCLRGYVYISGGPEIRPLHRDLQWSIVLPLSPR
jgi:hypothetical protein